MLIDYLQKTKKESKSLKKTGDSRHIYQNELGKARCFQHDMAMKILKIYLEEQLLIKYCVIKYLILLKIWNIKKILKYEKVSGGAIKNENMSNKKLAELLHKTIIRKFKKRKVLIFYRQYLGCWSFCSGISEYS